MKKVNNFIKRQWGILLSLIVIFASIILLGIYAANDGSYYSEDKTSLWVETILIGMLIDIASALIIILVIEDKEKERARLDREKEETIAKKEMEQREERTKYLMMVVATSNNKIREYLLNVVTYFTKQEFTYETGEIFLSKISDEKNIYMSFDYSLPCSHYSEVTKNRSAINKNWMEYTYFVFKKQINKIVDFLPAYFPFLPIDLYNEIYDLQYKMTNKLFIWEESDIDITKEDTYSVKDNKLIIILSIIPYVLEMMTKINEKIKQEYPPVT
jgi:hypothetical protein